MTSGTRPAPLAASAEGQARYEAREVARIRADLVNGAITMRDAQLQLVEMVLRRTGDFPKPAQEALRRRLLDTVEADPYFQLALEISTTE